MRIGIHGPFACFCCSSPDLETVDHLFCSGELATAIWKFFSVVIGILPSGCGVRPRIISWWLAHASNEYIRFVLHVLPITICWHIWKARNVFVHESRRLPWEVMVQRILTDFQFQFDAHFLTNMTGVSSWPQFFHMLSNQSRISKVLLVRWQTPSQVPKLNSDGCSKGNPGVSAGGGLLRDTDGKLIFAYA